ncbi:Nodulation-signaling pathway 1 protein [Heracleum sosnowskyi]|uniref:Nodulation-signaling pathway 1 protein n=1 Tax=Heracleum sosnowskyi TaxID=360622 RepID=A0AAD8M403_9APIA|nr:Nodulation-signaling pathway 1 protein [Heracleum sosnowskyi]
MTEPEPVSDQILDWIDGTIKNHLSCYPYSLDNSFYTGALDNDSWFDICQDLDQEFGNNNFTSINHNSASNTTAATSTLLVEPIISNHQSPPETSKKRKSSGEPNPNASRAHNKNQNRRSNEADDGDKVAVDRRASLKRPGIRRRGTKLAGSDCNSNFNEVGRWAEQLLNPCAIAITAGNLNRVQHLLYVLHELASPTGDANHRLAVHGLQALTHHLSAAHTYSVSAKSMHFASAKPSFFKDSLIYINDINPWFTIPNNIANASILRILSQQQSPQNLHIVDIGVSHGVQWPTLLYGLTRKPGGPPKLVRLTVIAPPSDSNESIEIPFAVGPPGYSSVPQLIAYAKSLNVSLHINIIEAHSLQSLNAQVLGSTPDETLIICAQFRVHQLNHHNPDDRTKFLKAMRSLEPKAMILSENDMDCSCNNCGNFATGFARRVEYLWKFLDSTSAAFKGGDSEERRMIEGETAKTLTYMGEMNERKEKWCERMHGVGFTGEVFGEDAIDGARVLLKKYDRHWEMRVEEGDGCVGLWWKGQPVSFCSLWTIDRKQNYK